MSTLADEVNKPLEVQQVIQSTNKSKLRDSHMAYFNFMNESQPCIAQMRSLEKPPKP